MEILVKSSVDGSLEPSLFYKASCEGRPLLVGLHTWSYDRFNQIDNLLPIAEKYNLNLLLPEFRGSNLKVNPRCSMACGSPIARSDIKDAIDYVTSDGYIDKESIFLLGLSGGGHMALLMCADYPELFLAVGAYVPIVDLNKWVCENASYRDHVLACCNNSEEQMSLRSPISYIENISRANLKIFHGKYDNVVPVSHSLTLFAEIMKHNPTSRTFLDIFDGGHEIDLNTAMYWFLSQYEEKSITEVTG